MTEVDLSAVRESVKAAVCKAAAAGTLEEVTFGQIRSNVENELGLEANILKTAEYKRLVKEMITSATDEAEQEAEAAKVAAKETKTRKRKSAEGKAVPKHAKKPKVDGRSSKRGSKPKRSSSIIPSDLDEEDSLSAKTAKSGSSSQVKDAAPSKRRKQVGDEDEGEKEDNTAPQASTSAVVVEDSVEPASATGEDGAEKSDSEMSVLIDEPPKRGKKKVKDSEDPKPSRGRKKAPAEELSKDDQTIKRLKSLVVACGVRKVWAKEFKNIDSKSEQIRHLKRMLSDLGMSVRMSMEQAKAIKEKREFEQELADVKEFERAVVTGPKTRGGRLANKKSKDESSDEEMFDVPTKPKTTARNHIMAFLGDQSDSE